MYLSAIKFCTEKSNKEYYFRFPRSPGKIRNSFVVVGDDEMIKNLESALQYGIGLDDLNNGSSETNMQSVVLNLLDADGQSWVFDRRTNEIKAYLDKKPVTGSIDGHLKKIFEQNHSTKNGGSSLRERILGFFVLSDKNSNLIAITRADFHKSLDSKSHLDQLINEGVLEICKLAPEFTQFSADRLTKLLANLSKVYFQWAETQKQFEIIKNLSGRARPVDDNQLSQLESQIIVLEKIEKIGTDLLKSGNLKEILTEKYKSIDVKLQNLTTQTEITNLNAIKNDTDWSKILKLITRLSIYEQLVQSSDLASQKAKQSVAPILEAHYQTVDTILRNDSQITAELQGCFDLLSSAMNEVKQDTTSLSPKNIRRVFNFFRKNHQENASGEDGRHPHDNSEAISKNPSLDQSRLAVDYALGRIGELHANLSSNKAVYLEALNPIGERHERLVQEYGRLKYTWQELAKQNHLPSKSTIRNILKLIEMRGTLIDLLADRERLKNEIGEYTRKVSELKQLVLQWRQATQSSKDGALENIGQLFAETRQILEYSSKRKKQLTKLKEMQIEFETHKRLDRALTSRLQALGQQWIDCFSAAKAHTMPIKNDYWVKIFNYNSLVGHLVQKTSEHKIGKPIAELFDDSLDKHPLRFFDLDSDFDAKKMLDELAKTLKSSDQIHCNIVTTNDESTADILVAKGFSRAQFIVKDPTLPERKGASADAPVLSDKAQRALKMFAPSKKGKTAVT